MELNWKASWIAPRDAKNRKNYYFRARKKFNLSKLPARSTVYIAAESYYNLYLNGKIVGKGPIRGTRTLNFFDSYDVTSELKKGDNYVAVLVSCMNIPTFVAAPTQPAVLVQLDDLVGTDSTWETLLASDWKSDVPLFTFQTGFMEYRDFRKEPKGWETGEDNLQWESAEELFQAQDMPGKRLLPRDIPDLRTSVYLPKEVSLMATVPPVKSADVARTMNEELHENLTAQYKDKISGVLDAKEQNIEILPEPGGRGIVIIFNFEKEVIGALELDVSAPSDAIIDVGYGEELCNQRLSVSCSLPPPFDYYKFADRYILRTGRQTVGTILQERGFRMVQVVLRNFSSPITIHSVRAVDRRYPYLNQGQFTCSDDLLNRVWLVCCETISACTTDVFTDCPWRERSFWVNDMLVENITSLQAFGDSCVNKRAFRLAFSQLRDDGFLPGVCPSPEDGGFLPGIRPDPEQNNLVLIATNLFLPLMLEDYWLYTGDEALVAEMSPIILKILDKFKSWENEDGLLVPPGKYWNFFDWSYELNNISLNGKNTSALNWLYVLALESVKRILTRTDNQKDAAYYEQHAQLAAQGIERRFWIHGEKRYAEWIDDKGYSKLSTQLTHALALFSEHLPDEHRDETIHALSRGDMLMPELYLLHFVLAAMARGGIEKQALEVIRKYWGEIVLTGSPTIWEAGVHQLGKSAFGGWGSLCHGFATTPINFLQTVILGVYPVKPGFETFMVNPKPCGLTSAKGSVPTPRGCIEIEWRGDESANKLFVRLEIPEGTEARCADGRLFGHGCHEFTLVA